MRLSISGGRGLAFAVKVVVTIFVTCRKPFNAVLGTYLLSKYLGLVAQR